MPHLFAGRCLPVTCLSSEYFLRLSVSELNRVCSVGGMGIGCGLNLNHNKKNILDFSLTLTQFLPLLGYANAEVDDR